MPGNDRSRPAKGGSEKTIAAVNTSLSRADAERLTVRIDLKLGTLADAYESVMPLIRQAIDGRAHEALGYPSIGAYAADRFGDKLTRLGVDIRRDVVKELTAAGMSTRDIAPVVGVSHVTVANDQSAVKDLTPASIVGQDGKEYTRPSGERQPRQPVFKMESEIMAHLDRMAKRGHHHHIQRVINYAQGLLDRRNAADLKADLDIDGGES